MLEQALRGKTLIMLVGPTAVGKSTIMNKVVELDGEFGRVSGFTTRPKRPGDEAGLYRYLSHDEADELIQSESVVQYALNPANNQIYGTELRDYPYAFNMKDTLSGAVEHFISLPFSDYRIVSISVPVEPWLSWLDERHPVGSSERVTRLQEAKQSIEWSLRQSDRHAWIVNNPGDVDAAAASLIDSIRSPGENKPPQDALDMLKAIDDLLSYE